MDSNDHRSGSPVQEVNFYRQEIWQTLLAERETPLPERKSHLRVH